MFSDFPSVLALLAALGCGVIAGVFFAFSVFVMKALARLPAAQGIAAMQAINVAVLNPWFLGVFLGAGLLGAGAAVWSGLSGGGLDTLFRSVGAVLYLAGSVGVTMACNVPRNDALARLDAAHPDAADPWRRYVREWTAWNHVRTAASALAAAVFMLSLK